MPQKQNPKVFLNVKIVTNVIHETANIFFVLGTADEHLLAFISSLN